MTQTQTEVIKIIRGLIAHHRKCLQKIQRSHVTQNGKAKRKRIEGELTLLELVASALHGNMEGLQSFTQK